MKNPAAREKKRPMHTSLRSHSKQKATLVRVWGKLVEWLSAGRASSFVVDIAQFFAPAPQEKNGLVYIQKATLTNWYVSENHSMEWIQYALTMVLKLETVLFLQLALKIMQHDSTE